VSKTLTEMSSGDSTSFFLAGDVANFTHSAAASGAEKGIQALPSDFVYSRSLLMSCAFRQFQSCQREWRPYLFHISMWYYPRIHALERRYNLGVPIHESKKVAPKRQMNCDCMAWMGRD
jgi:hypothetical protein